MTASKTAEAVSRRRPSWLHEVEGLRAISFIFIVFGHAGGILYDVPHSVQTMAWFGASLAVTRFALAAFMMVSSLLIARRIQSDPEWSAWPSLMRLLGAYLAWTLLYTLVVKVAFGSQPITMWELAREIGVSLINGSAIYHLWYMLIAIQICVVAPLLTKAFQKVAARDRLWLLYALAALNVILLGQINGPLADTGIGRVIFGTAFDRIVLFWIAYIALGVLLGLDYDRAISALRSHRRWILPAYLVSAAFVAGLVIRQASAVGGDFQATADISRVMQAWILPFEALSIVAWLLVADLLVRTRLAALFTLLGAASFGGYLIHPFVLLVGRQYLWTLERQPDLDFAIAALFASALVGSVLLSLLFGRMSVSLGTLLVGSRQRRPKVEAQSE